MDGSESASAGDMQKEQRKKVRVSGSDFGIVCFGLDCLKIVVGRELLDLELYASNQTSQNGFF